MQIGVFMTMPLPTAEPAADIYARGLEMARAADDLGYSHLWLAEHHFTNYAYTPRPLVLLAHIAAITSRIRLGPAIVPVPMHHPLIVAEELAMIDVLSGGRLEVGLGKGYQQYQYDRLGKRKGEDPVAYEEAVTVIRRALHEKVCAFDGNAFQIPRTRLFPAPLQARAPIWLVVNTTVRATVEHAVREGMNMFTGVLEPVSALVDMRRRYPDLAPAMRKLRIGSQRPVFVGTTEAEAREAIEHARWNGRAMMMLRHDLARVRDGVIDVHPLPGEVSIDTLMAEHVVAGTAGQCIDQLRRIQGGLGCDYFSASFWFGGLPQSEVLDSMRRFATDVMPAFSSPTGQGASTCEEETMEIMQ
jgi:alkanesulfonate monooxygenase SsuD/methylene tetrahydromethanopterin reductase-like flavin-dependent oxidoreductase (luciferase family)